MSKIAECVRCGRNVLVGDDGCCHECAEIPDHQRRDPVESKSLVGPKREEQLRKRAEKVIVTTTNHIEGCVVKDYLGIESVEFVIGTSLFPELSGDFQDFKGWRSSASEVKLAHARVFAFGALKMLAAERGANAVIGVDLGYSEFSGNTEFSGNRVALVVSGTLVRIAKRAKHREGS